jgi:hypothetical protein
MPFQGSLGGINDFGNRIRRTEVYGTWRAHTFRPFGTGDGGITSGLLHEVYPRGAGYFLSSQRFHSMTEAVLDDQYSISAAGRC